MYRNTWTESGQVLLLWFPILEHSILPLLSAMQSSAFCSDGSSMIRKQSILWLTRAKQLYIMYLDNHWFLSFGDNSSLKFCNLKNDCSPTCSKKGKYFLAEKEFLLKSDFCILEIQLHLLKKEMWAIFIHNQNAKKYFFSSCLLAFFEVTILNLLKNIYVYLVNKSSCKLNPCWQKVQVSSLYKLTDNCVNLQPLKRKEKKAILITLLSFTLHLLSSLAALRWDVNLPVNAVRKWMVQEGQELEISIRCR